MDHQFDVFTALHDDVKMGGAYTQVWSRVLISSQTYPSATDASEAACQLAVSIHGGMAVACLMRI